MNCRLICSLKQSFGVEKVDSTRRQSPWILLGAIVETRDNNRETFIPLIVSDFEALVLGMRSLCARIVPDPTANFSFGSHASRILPRLHAFRSG